MTVYEIACRAQNTACSVAECEWMDLGIPSRDTPLHRLLAQDATDSAFALGLLIDSMPIELAEREV